MRRLAQICLVATIAGATSYATEAQAAVPTHLPMDEWVQGSALGNGKHNHNSFIINSPSWSHDVQHIRNVNIGGNTVTPAALCKRSHHCKIIQRLIVTDH
jgi:hypothetical protein